MEENVISRIDSFDSPIFDHHRSQGGDGESCGCYGQILGYHHSRAQSGGGERKRNFWLSYSSFIDFVLQCHPQQCQYWWDDFGPGCWSITFSLELLWQ